MKSEINSKSSPEPSPQAKPSPSTGSEMLTTSEIALVKQDKADHFDFLKKAYPGLRTV